jgi:hypothetical protein
MALISGNPHSSQTANLLPNKKQNSRKKMFLAIIPFVRNRDKKVKKQSIQSGEVTSEKNSRTHSTIIKSDPNYAKKVKNDVKY